MSTPVSPLSPMDPRGVRRLSSRRRGSMAAPDPFGTIHVQDKERGMSSTLTITRAPPQVDIQDVDVKARRRRSTGYHGKPLSGGGPASRISFAFSAFTPITKDQDVSRRGVGDAPSPSSPSRPSSRSNSFSARVTPLTPMQVYEVAQQCNHPHSRPPTPGGNVPAPSTPVSYTPLPDAVYLPFLDRPSEVEALLSTPPTSTMFSLLAQTFPSSGTAQVDANPASWSYETLKRWLTQVDRDQAEDLEWVQKAKTCISTRSELIWERVKGALGVPPELDSVPGLGPSVLNSPLDDGEHVEEGHDYFGDAWVEPIISGPSPRPPSGELVHSPSLGRQNVDCMEEISEDAPDLGVVPPSPPSSIHGLRLITSPLESPGRPETSPAPTHARSFSPSNVPYNAVAERGPGHPLFPSSFASLAIEPTLSANNTALRVPTAPPPSAYPSIHSPLRPQARFRASSWADGWDAQKQEYAVSVASVESKVVE